MAHNSMVTTMFKAIAAFFGMFRELCEAGETGARALKEVAQVSEEEAKNWAERKRVERATLIEAKPE